MKKVWGAVQLWVVILLALFVLSACVAREQVVLVRDPLSLSESPEQGLGVHYYYEFYRHIDHMPSDDSMLAKGTAGQAIPFLNHHFIDEENVFGSSEAKGVGMLLTGYLKMTEPGEYRFQAMSNDGVRVTVGGQVVILDPTVHSDSLSKVGNFVVDSPSWHPLSVKYFQRKGTARLELYWQPPGAAEFEIIPAAAYGHLPGAAASLQID